MAKPKLALIPAAQGTSLYSVLPSSGVGDFDFTRSGSATRINSKGLIETVTSGVSRLNYPMIDGVVKGCPHHLLEPMATNLVTYSERFDNAYWTKTGASVTSGFISPDGTANAFKLTKTGSGNSLVRLVSGLTNVLYTNSFYIKRVSGSGNVSLILPNGTNEVVDIYNEWKRYSVTSLPSGGTGAFTGLILSQTNDEVLIYGTQLEVGSYATSYIPTQGAIQTRVAETANGSGDASTFNDSEGVLMAEISALAKDTNYELISISDGTNNIHIDLGYNNTTTESYKQVKFGGDNVFGDFTDPIDQTTFNKMAIKYKSGDSSFYVNGFEIDSSSTEFTPTSSMDELKFSYFTAGDKFFGNVKQLQYFDTALNSEDLEKLTSWVSFTDMANGQLYTIE